VRASPGISTVYEVLRTFQAAAAAAVVCARSRWKERLWRRQSPRSTSVTRTMHNGRATGRHPLPSPFLETATTGLGAFPSLQLPSPACKSNLKFIASHTSTLHVWSPEHQFATERDQGQVVLFQPGSPRGHEMSLAWLRRHRSRWRRSQSILPPCHDMAASESLHVLSACTIQQEHVHVGINHVAEQRRAYFVPSVPCSWPNQRRRRAGHAGCTKQQAARPSHGLHPLWCGVTSTRWPVVTEARAERDRDMHHHARG
jgi:hypothetical protein